MAEGISELIIFFIGLSVLSVLSVVDVSLLDVPLLEFDFVEGVGLAVVEGAADGLVPAGLCSLMKRVICDCAFCVHWLMLS